MIEYRSPKMEIYEMLLNSYSWLIPVVLIAFAMMMIGMMLALMKGSSANSITIASFMIVFIIAFFWMYVDNSNTEEMLSEEIEFVNGLDRYFVGIVIDIGFKTSGSVGVLSQPVETTILKVDSAIFKINGTMKINLRDSLFALNNEDELEFLVDRNNSLFYPRN